MPLKVNRKNTHFDTEYTENYVKKTTPSSKRSSTVYGGFHFGKQNQVSTTSNRKESSNDNVKTVDLLNNSQYQHLYENTRIKIPVTKVLFLAWPKK